MADFLQASIEAQVEFEAVVGVAMSQTPAKTDFKRSETDRRQSMKMLMLACENSFSYEDGNPPTRVAIKDMTALKKHFKAVFLQYTEDEGTKADTKTIAKILNYLCKNSSVTVNMDNLSIDDDASSWYRFSVEEFTLLE